MKNMRVLLNINIATYFLILTFLFTGLIKNIILIYLIVIFHELGHLFIIKMLKYQVLRIDIYPMGGVTKINKKINTSIKDELLISIFGIVFQIILALIFMLLIYNNLISSNTYLLFKTYNITIMLFNMIPIIPLDGYIFVRSILELIFPYKKSFYLSFIISLISIILFISINELYSLNNYLIISFLIYKIYEKFKDFKFENLKFQLERHLFDLKYHKIKNEKVLNLDLLRKDTYHYFKQDNTYISEKKVLSKKFY